MATLTFEQFSNVYDLCLKMLSFGFSLPAVKAGAYHDAVLRLGIRGDVSSGRAATWREIADYQRFQLKLYLKNFWRDMLAEDVDGRVVYGFWLFMQNHSELILFLGKELFAFMSAVKKKFYWVDEECVLTSKEAEKILESYSFDTDLHRHFAEIMAAKVGHFNDSMAYSANYLVFLEWLPKWQEKYPDVWKAVGDELREMKSAGIVNLRWVEHKRIYNLYCSEN